MAIKKPLTNLQIEILKLYSTDLSEKELNELKLVLARHYAEKAIKEVDEIWEKCNYSEEQMEV